MLHIQIGLNLFLCVLFVYLIAMNQNMFIKTVLQAVLDCGASRLIGRRRECTYNRKRWEIFLIMTTIFYLLHMQLELVIDALGLIFHSGILFPTLLFFVALRIGIYDVQLAYIHHLHFGFGS